MFGASEEIHVEHLQNNTLNALTAICGVIVQPVELILRPWSGTRYTPLPVSAAAATLMLFLPIVTAFFMNLGHMIPFFTVSAPRGMFDLASFSELYFVLSALHGVRLWKRMKHMEREAHSKYEGEALPFFKLLPWGKSFWPTRIVLEPAFVLVVAIVLEDFLIIQPLLSLYLRFAALALLIKACVTYFRAWEFLRSAMDTAISGPALARLIENQSTEEDKATLHLCSFPEGIDPEIRNAAAIHIARSYAADE